MNQSSTFAYWTRFERASDLWYNVIGCMFSLVGLIGLATNISALVYLIWLEKKTLFSLFCC